MNQLTRLFRSLSIPQRVTLLVAALVIGGGLWATVHWNRERNFKPLYTGLAVEDAGAVVAKLREQGVEYRLDDNGSTLKVPSERIDEARLQIATAGLPKTGRIGFELFDATNFGLTEFAEQVNFRRAIEGELERSILSLAEVERARVHISLPKDSVFLESRQEAKASVMVKLRPRARLSEQNGFAICHLVASAVDRLSPDAVTVIDSEGNLLIRPRRSTAQAGADAPDAGLEYKQKIERDLIRKINATLEPLLGADNFRAGASVEVDLASTEQSEETFDPNKTVIITSQKSEDVAGINQSAGVPGTASNLPRPPARPAGAATGASRHTEATTFQPSKVVRHTRLPQGAIKRMSLAVLVGQTVRWQGAGSKAQRILEPPTPEKLKTVRDLVAAATGLSTDRGDQLIVDTQPFEWALRAEPPLEPSSPATPRPVAWWQKYLSQMSLPLLIGIAAAVLLTLAAPVVFLIWRARKKHPAVAPPPAVGEGARPKEIQSGPNYEEELAQRTAEIERREADLLKQMLPPIETKKTEVLSKHLKKLAKSDPVSMANMLRTWLNEG